MSLNANDLIIFAHIMRAGSFSKAAERINLPKSTLSRRISDLEELLGERLIARSTRQLLITDFGERILAYAERLLEESEAASAFALNRQVTPQGKLRVSLPPEFKEFSFVDFFIKFLEKYPSIDLELDLSARCVDMIAERFDVAIRVASHLPDDATLVARKITDLQNGIYASPLYLSKFGEPKAPEDLLDMQAILLSNSQGEHPAWCLHQGTKKCKVLPKYKVISNSVAFNQNLAIEGMGLIATSDFFACQYVRQGILQRVLPEWHLPSDTIWCVTPGRRLLPSRTQAFIDMFKELMQAEEEITKG